MKIVSINEKTSIDNVLKRDILIPVKIYKVPIIANQNDDLNFLEKTILNLQQIDKSLEDKDIINLLGLGDKSDLVKFILDKIKEQDLIQINQKEEKNKVKIYWFYQELITGKLLPIVSEEIKNFFYIKEKKWSKIENILNIKFEKNNRDWNVQAFKYENYSQPNQDEFIKTVLLNNQSFVNSKYLAKINYKELSNFNIDDNEIIYLHTRLFIPADNRNIILVTDGLDGDFSNILSNVIENNFIDFINNLKEKSKIDIEKTKQDIEIPFDNKINNYMEIKHLIINIERDFIKYKDAKSSDEKGRYKKEILKNLFDAIEKSFEILSKNLNNSKLINKQRVLNLVKSKNFKIKEEMNIFGVSYKNNIQKFIAKTIFHNCEEVNKLDKNIFIFLDRFLVIRNDLKHSAPIELDNINVENYIKNSYRIISIILRVKEIDIKRDNLNSKNNIAIDDNELYFNATNDIDSEFFTIKNKLDNDLKDKIAQIKFYVDEISFSQNIIKQTINEIYSIFEYLFKDIEETDKKKIFEKYRDLPIELQKVKIKKSLGSYYLNYLYFYSNREDLTIFIAKIIGLRGHGNQKIANLKLSKDELIELKDKTFKYIKEIMEER